MVYGKCSLISNTFSHSLCIQKLLVRITESETIWVSAPRTISFRTALLTKTVLFPRKLRFKILKQLYELCIK